MEERIYNIPLRKEFQKAPSYKRASKATRALREFIIKHMKAKEVKIGKYLNLEIWKNGRKNPPSKVSVKAIKDGDVVRVELVNAPVEIPKVKKKGAKKEEDKKQDLVKTEETPKEEEIQSEETKKEPINKVPKKIPTATELKSKK